MKFKVFLFLLLMGGTCFGQIPQNGLIAHYPFNGNTNDESGNGHHGTNNGALLVADRCGVPNSAYSFNGSTFIEVPHDPSLNVTTALTMSAWVNLPNTNADQKIFSKHELFKTGYILNVTIGANGSEIRDNNFDQVRPLGGTVPNNTWTHIATTWAVNDSMRHYVNGVQVASAPTNSAPMDNNTQSLFIGKSSFGFNTTGAVDDIYIYNVQLDSTGIQQLYHQYYDASISALNSLVQCQGDSVTLEVDSGAATTFQWLLNNSPLPGGINQQFMAANPGSYSAVAAYGTCIDTTDALSVTLNPTFQIFDTSSVCQGASFTFPDGSTQTNILSSFAQTSPLQTILGCDSLVQTYIKVDTLDGSISALNSLVQCRGDSVTLEVDSGAATTFQWLFNNSPIPGGINQQFIAANPGNYRAVVANGICTDTTNALTVTLNPAFQIFDTNSVCQGASFTFPDGSTQTNILSSFVQTSQLQTILGCDSLVQTYIEVDTVDASIFLIGSDTLMANVSGASYQWLDCGNGFGPIPNATGQTFVPGASGSYAVMLTQNACSDTSACQSVTLISVDQSVLFAQIQVSPNPFQESFQIDFQDPITNGRLSIVDPFGRELFSQMVNESEKERIDMAGYAAGIYFVKIQVGEQVRFLKILKEN